jgi:predicted TPR repeat methyltransferase
MSRASLPKSYFDELYAADADPWQFASSAYEQAKYAETMAALPDSRSASAFEVGCSIGVLTRQLAGRCERLLAVDIAEKPLEEARARCVDLPHVAFARMDVPRAWPDAQFDLIVLSEVLYYLAPADIAATACRVQDSITLGGTVILVHWTGVTNYPCGGDEAVTLFARANKNFLRPTKSFRTAEYRLDRFECTVDPCFAL